MPANEIKVTAPGRICLFGEHQDYLRLPVISAAISLKLTILAEKIDENKLIIELQNLKKIETIPLENREIQYEYSRDYLRSAYNLFIRKGYRLNRGYRCQIQSEIPINAGVASSSALIIAWINFLAGIFNVPLSPTNIAELGYQAEVDEFREAGGRMDHYTAALGGLLYLTTRPPYLYENLGAVLEDLVLGDSLERKDTVADLTRVREKVQIGISQLRRAIKNFDIQHISIKELYPQILSLSPEIASTVKANIINRDLTQQAKQLLSSNNFSPKEVGKLLNLHHEQLSQNLNISTPKIEKLIEVAKDAGALGAKINGSGFGGCMFAYAPDNVEEVMKAIESAGGKAYKISVSEGCRITYD